MPKTLGLDLGTNSIGWAIVNTDFPEKILDKGVHIFSEGVKIEKGVESSRAAERTAYRSARKLIARRRQRKQQTLKVLADHNMCPLKPAEVRIWVMDKKQYPKKPEFIEWLRTDEAEGINPYALRDKASRGKIGQMELGRALYHLAQRRGFKSNRLDQTDEDELGPVKESKKRLSEKISDAKCNTMGQYFHSVYLKNQSGSIGNNLENIRKVWIPDREEHYLAEFEVICEVQKLDERLRDQLRSAIFYQRPLKSQKHQIGRCTLEPDKLRCSVSHPDFEEFRARQFINSIKKQDENGKFKQLNEEERENLWPKFTRLSKPTFEFKDLMKEITPGGQEVRFNYKPYEVISGCPFHALIENLFGADWKQTITGRYQRSTKKDGSIKSPEEIIHDIWHVLFSFDDKDKVKAFGSDKLGLGVKQQDKLADFRPKREYGRLSLKAIRKILPHLRNGHIFSYAVFMANLPEGLEDKQQREIGQQLSHILDTHRSHTKEVEIVNRLIGRFREDGLASHGAYQLDTQDKKEVVAVIHEVIGEAVLEGWPVEKQQELISDIEASFEKQLRLQPQGKFVQPQRLDERIKTYLSEVGLTDNQLDKLYHPSIIDPFEAPKVDPKDGKRYLASPAIPSIKNPMAMRTLYQLRHLINALIREGKLDENYTVNIELTRQLKDANERAAIRRYQQELRREREAHRNEIIKLFKTEHGKNIEPSVDELLKYKLWEEQGHQCIYTGLTINVSDFVGGVPIFDIEHTLPFSLSQDNSQANKTLAHQAYNRKVKGQKLPVECPNYNEEKTLSLEGKAVSCPPITRVFEKWQKTLDELEKQYNRRKLPPRGRLETKLQKDRRLQDKHYFRLKRDYWREKIARFKMTEVKTGFKNSQLVDTGFITRHARAYLNMYFDKVYSIKGDVTAAFRVHWGLQKEGEPKERDYHTHHAEDAITLACITKDLYDRLARATRYEEEGNPREGRKHIAATKPWPTFTEDVKAIRQEVLISHHTPDQTHKQTRRKLRKRGKLVRDSKGQKIYARGDTARGSLHKDTYYGAISDSEGEVRYVVRRAIATLKPGDIANIVDPVIREIIEKEVAAKGFKEAIDAGFSMASGVPVKKVRCYAKTVTDPIHLKPHTFVRSVKPRLPHKEEYHVVNDENFALAVYAGEDARGKKHRQYEVVNMMEAAEYYKLSNQLSQDQPLIPGATTVGKKQEVILPYQYMIKKGTMVLFYQNELEELLHLSSRELNRRLYKVTKFDKEGRVFFRFHTEARQASTLKPAYAIDLQDPPPLVRLPSKSVDKFKIAVEGVHFDLHITGRIKWRPIMDR